MFEVQTVFLLVFVVSFVLTILSFVLGVADLSIGGHVGGHGGGHLHLPHDVHLPHGHVPHDLHLGHGLDAHGVAHADGISPGDGHGTAEGMSPFNMATILAFLTWFGGAGFLLTAYAGVATILALVLATGVGLVGAGLVFAFMVRVLLPGQTPYLKADDYELVGTIGRLTTRIRPGGTGELVYSKNGARRVASARTEDNRALERGAEVVVVRQEGGTAYVELFEQYLKSSE